jgi:hypothetical protein
MSDEIVFQVEEITLAVTIAEADPLEFQVVEQTLEFSTVEDCINVTAGGDAELIFLQTVDEIIFEVQEVSVGGAGQTVVVQTQPAPGQVQVQAEPSEVDLVNLGDFQSVKWYLVISNPLAGTFLATEISAVHNGTTVHFTEYGTIGDAINYEVDVTIEGGGLRLNVINGETDPLDVSVVRIPVSVPLTA